MLVIIPFKIINGSKFEIKRNVLTTWMDYESIALNPLIRNRGYESIDLIDRLKTMDLSQFI